MIQIKCCPFCGSEGVISEFKRSKTEMIGVLTDKVFVTSLPSQFYVKCNNKKCNACQPQTKYFNTKEEAVATWNTRNEDL